MKTNTNTEYRKQKTAKIATIILAIMAVMTPSLILAADPITTLSTPQATVNPNDPGFRLIICDGPPQANQINNGVVDETIDPRRNGYVPCDFNGMMLEARHLIDIAMVAAVLIAIVGITYAGVMYTTGVQKNIDKAKELFPKLIWGFIIILTAWFIVFQILSWLTNEPGFKTLLGK